MSQFKKALEKAKKAGQLNKVKSHPTESERASSYKYVSFDQVGVEPSREEQVAKKKDEEISVQEALRRSGTPAETSGLSKDVASSAREGEISLEEAKYHYAQGGMDAESHVYSQTRQVSLDRDLLLDRKVFAILEQNIVADQYKLLRTMMLHRMRPLGHNTIVVTSSKEREGKTLTVVNLGITIARETRQTVMLVDLDLRQPMIHSYLGISISPGIRDYFSDDVPLKDMLLNPGIESLTVIPAGGRMPNSTEIIGSYRMELMVNEIKNRYPDRYVIFDTPPLASCPDAIVLAGYVDTLLLVARSDYTTGADLTKSVGLLKGVNIAGVVFNEGKVSRQWAY